VTLGSSDFENHGNKTVDKTSDLREEDERQNERQNEWEKKQIEKIKLY
jgi:hypothetical protein